MELKVFSVVVDSRAAVYRGRKPSKWAYES